MNEGAPVQVSVIVATYNYGRFIAQTLASVRDQTLREWECIVVDDASTDDTPAVVARFTEVDTRFRYIRLDRNMGVSAARNRALTEARGTFIQLLDADDLLLPGKLEGQVALFMAEPGVTVVYSDFEHFMDQPGDGSGGYAPDERISGPGSVLMRRLIRGNIFRPATVLFRASILERSGLFKERFRHVEDLDLWYRIARAGAVFRFLDDPACKAWVRVHEGSLSHDLSSMRRTHLPVLQHIWVQGGLPIRVRGELLLRYVDAMLESLIMHGKPVDTLPEGRLPFLAIVGVLAILLLPVWLLIRPFRYR